MPNDHDHPNHAPASGGMPMALMMGLMMSACILLLAAFVLIPLLGWPLGIAIGVVGAVAVLWAHQRFMGHRPGDVGPK